MNVWHAKANEMDAYDIAEKIKKYWMVLYPKDSGAMTKSKDPIKVIVMTEEGYREVRGIVIKDKQIELVLDGE
jgi:hypothetical protein